jgi:hypothetical protein
MSEPSLHERAAREIERIDFDCDWVTIAERREHLVAILARIYGPAPQQAGEGVELRPPVCESVESLAKELEGWFDPYCVNPDELTKRRAAAYRKIVASHIIEAEELQKALESVLLFYESPYWDAASQARWIQLTGKAEATTKVLADTVRRALVASEPGKETRG